MCIGNILTGKNASLLDSALSCFISDVESLEIDQRQMNTATKDDSNRAHNTKWFTTMAYIPHEE
jgi:hypothetical protein